MISAQNLVYSLQGRRLTDNVSLTFPGGNCCHPRALMVRENLRCFAS